jgi:hypothetical protein
MKAMSVALLVAMMAFGAFGALKTCSDTACATCVTDNTAAGACQSQSGASAKYTCSADNVTISSWANSDCSGTALGTFSIGKPGVCQTYGTGSFMATCAASWATVAAAVAAVLAAMMF